jgi:hypothetical protein
MLPLALVACTGQVRTVILPPGPLPAGSTHEGGVAYQPQYVKQTFAYTARVDPQGAVVGSASDATCTPVVQKEDVSLLPDLGRPMLIRNASGALSAAKFSVTLNSGMVASVNAEPTQKPSDLISASSVLLKEAAAVKTIDGAGARPACNASPRLVAFERIDLK